MVMATMTRRRFMQVTALAGIASALPFSAIGKEHGDLYHWRGMVLGADASMQICLPEKGRAKMLVQRCLAEITRLERIFSLHDPRSALSVLNRQGSLGAPPPELAE